MTTGEGGTATPGEALEPTEIHDVLRNERRRLVLEQLLDADSAESVRDLAEHIASIEAGESPPPRNVRQSVYVSLHQTHLPKLDELRIVDYDSETKTVRLDGHADEVALYFEVDDADEAAGSPQAETDPTWALRYGGVGLAGAVVLFGNFLGVPGVSAVPGALLGAAFLLVVSLLAVSQSLSERESAQSAGADSDE
ncbi:MAG: hypothetical protein ABEJ22_07175 [Haloferacaceae archaeon]